MKNEATLSKSKQNSQASAQPTPSHSSLSPNSVLSLQNKIGNQAVQRLMSVDDFKTSSKLGIFKRRNLIVPVDTALAAYNAVNTDRPTIANKKALLDTLITAIDTYLAGTGTRVTATQQLRQQAIHERSIIDVLADAATLAPLAAFERLLEAQDIQVKLLGDGLIPRQLADVSTWVSGAVTTLRATPAHIEQALENDVDALRAILASAATPQLLKDILTEVLSNVDNVHLESMVPGARKKKATEGFAEDYVVNHNLNAPLGTAERLGSLTHELTHVSVSETFDNSDLFLAFTAGTSDDDIVELSNERTDQLKALMVLKDQSRLFNAGQKSLLNNKIDYPYGKEKGDIGRYLTSMAGKIPAALRDRLQGLLPRGINNTLIEFDTVINQMMVYMHLWEIPQADPFYAKLREIAQEAYDYRAAARG